MFWTQYQAPQLSDLLQSFPWLLQQEMELQQLGDFRVLSVLLDVLEDIQEIIKEKSFPRTPSCRSLHILGLIGPGCNRIISSCSDWKTFSPDVDDDWTVGAVCPEVVSLFSRVHREVDQLLVVENRLVGDVSEDGGSHKSLHDLPAVPGDVHQDTELPHDLPRAEEHLQAPHGPLVLEEVVVGHRPYWYCIITGTIKKNLQSDVIPRLDQHRQLEQIEIFILTVALHVMVMIMVMTVLMFAGIFLTFGNDFNVVMVNLNPGHKGCLRESDLKDVFLTIKLLKQNHWVTF